MVPQSLVHAPANLLMLRGRRKVANFIRIARQIIKLLHRLLLPESELLRSAMSKCILPLPKARGRRLEHVRNMLSADLMWHVVADVHIAFVAHAPDHIVALIHTTA